LIPKRRTTQQQISLTEADRKALKLLKNMLEKNAKGENVTLTHIFRMGLHSLLNLSEHQLHILNNSIPKPAAGRPAAKIL
jgi:hypothetical protein